MDPNVLDYDMNNGIEICKCDDAMTEKILVWELFLIETKWFCEIWYEFDEIENDWNNKSFEI